MRVLVHELQLVIWNGNPKNASRAGVEKNCVIKK
jgi:hypothetical protein